MYNSGRMRSEEKINTSVFGVILAVIAAMAYGTIPVFSKAILQTGMSAVTILCYRHFICVILLGMICFKRAHRVEKWSGRHSGRAHNTAEESDICAERSHISVKGKTDISLVYIQWALLGAFVYAVQSGLYMLAIERTEASITTMLFCTYPLFVPVLMVLFGHEKISPIVFICSLCALGGLWLLLGTRAGLEFHIGMAFGLSAGFIYAAYIFLGSRIKSDGIDAITKTLCVLFGAFLAFTAAGLVTHSLEFHMTMRAAVILAGMALMCNILSTVCFWKSVAYIGATRASLIGILEPVTSMILTVLILHESLNARQWIGIVVILLSISIVQVMEGRE